MKSNNTYCSLCLNSRELRNGHIIPSFVFKWLKKTSATGYFRNHQAPNLRQQDGWKYKLLCDDCEQLLNKYETEFSKNIFHPYVNEELDKNGVALSNIKHFEYADWFLKFIISIHWRTCITSKLTNIDLGEELFKIRETQIEKWRQFLNGDRNDTGENESYVIFLQNLATGHGVFPDELNDKVNHYLLRAIDSTTVTTKSKMGIYAKLGPIAFFTNLKPAKMKKVIDIRVRMKGKLKTAQVLDNTDIASFIFITRPNEVYENLSISKKQLDIIDESFKKNPDRVANSLTVGALKGDIIIEEKKNNRI